MISALLRQYSDLGLPAEETDVAAALGPLSVGSIEQEEEREAYLAKLLRTCTAFVIDVDDLPALSDALIDASKEAADGLPPLPYARIWVEFGGDMIDPVPWIPLSEELAGAVGMPQTVEERNYGLGISGDDEGWDVFWVVEYSDRPRWLYVMAYRVCPDASTIWGERMASDYTLEEGRIWGWWPILIVQILTVLGSRRESVDVPRNTRRAHKRRYGVEFPTIYFLDLSGTGEVESSGASSREYRHRWLVRGHWRTLNGRRERERHRTWVRAHVKGPAGAPWKGRPIYTTEPGRMRAPTGGEVGRLYQLADEAATVAASAKERDTPDATERGVRAHAVTQNRLAHVVEDLGLAPLSPRGDEPEFDLAWKIGETLWVAEVKSLTADTEERQMRMAVGQVLRYCQRLRSNFEGDVRAMIAVERQPDEDWLALCAEHGIVLVSPENMEERVKALSGEGKRPRA